MDRAGMPMGARFQRRWTSGKANRNVGKPDEGRGSDGPLAIEKIPFDWILKFPRGRRLFEEIQREDVLFSEAGRKLLAQRALDLINAGGQFSATFGAFPEGLAREKEYLNYRAIDAYDSVEGGLDDLTATLGRFAIFAIPKGSAWLDDGPRLIVRVDEIGFYVRDSFDFEGDQDLGWWKLPDQVKFPDPFSSGRDWPGGGCENDWIHMTNESYNVYRQRHISGEEAVPGGRGEDFLVYTDIKVLPGPSSALVWTFKDGVPVPKRD
jgi:hypothetical protein